MVSQREGSSRMVGQNGRTEQHSRSTDSDGCKIDREVLSVTRVVVIAGSPWKNNKGNAAAKLARDTPCRLLRSARQRLQAASGNETATDQVRDLMRGLRR